MTQQASFPRLTALASCNSLQTNKLRHAEMPLSGTASATGGVISVGGVPCTAPCSPG